MGAFAGPFTGGQLNVAAANFAKMYRNNMLIGDMLAPRCPMDRQTFQYVVHDRSAMRLDAQTLRAPGDAPQAVRSSFSTASYFCKSHALAAKIPFETEQYGLGFGFSEIAKATQNVMDKLLLDREVYLANLLLNPTNTPNTLALAGAAMWDQYGGGINGTSQPIQNVEAAKAVVRQSGVLANVLIISDPTFVALQNHPVIIDRFKYTVKGAITLDDLSTVFGINTVVASAFQVDKNNVGSFVWGQSAILAYVQDVSSQNDLSALKTFVWTAASQTVDGYGVLVEPQYPLSSKTTLVSTDWYWDVRITAPETLYTFTNTVAAPAIVAIPAPVANY
jgi:hypothetical protein